MVLSAREIWRRNMENVYDDVDVESEDTSPKGLREQLKKEQQRRKDAESQLVGLTLGELGLNPDEGLGKAVSKLYDGKIDKESIKEYVATEFNVSPEENASSEVPTEPVVNNSEQVQSSEARVQQLNQVAGRVETQTLEDQFAEVLQNGSSRETIRAKMHMMDKIKEQDKR